VVFNNFMEMVGNTPIVRFSLPAEVPAEGYIKLEGFNPTGSVKDRAAIALIQDKIQTGELAPGKTILDASSGSFACSIAFFGKILGFPVTVVTGGKMTQDKVAFIEYFGARRISRGNFTIEGNRHCTDMISRDESGSYCFLDQLHNWKNAETHYRTTGPEILRDMPDVAAVAFSLGSGGTMNGVGRYIKETQPGVRVIAVTAASGTKIPGTGAFIDGDYVTPFIADSRARGLFDYTAMVSMEGAIERVKELRRQGFYVGIQTGAVYQGMVDAVRELGIAGKVLVISGDAGWKNMDKLISLVEPE
jgi:[CysO sulfur-carrier protein]-thiocarboxylate-dependent cysteine synthase